MTVRELASFSKIRYFTRRAHRLRIRAGRKYLVRGLQPASTERKIVSFDEAKQKWNFVCDSEPEEVPYLMAYEAVYKYVDVTASTFGSFVLPPDPINGSDRVVVEEGGVVLKFETTDELEWEKIDVDDNGDPAGRVIDPIPWEGGDEEFSVKITDGELESLRDEKGEIKFERVLQWSLPRFGDNNEVALFEWQAKMMRSYMTMLIENKSYKPRYYKNGKTITPDHIARFYGALLGKMLPGKSFQQPDVLHQGDL